MAIVPLQYITLVGELKHRENVIGELQRLGCVHITDLGEPHQRGPGNTARLEELKSAISYLESCPEKRPPSAYPHPDPSQASSDLDHDDLKRIAAEVVQIETKSRSLAEEREALLENIEQLRPWGDFHLPSADKLRGRRFYFYRLTPRQANGIPISQKEGGHAFLISVDAQHEYWAIIAEQLPVGMPSQPETLDSRSLSELELRVEAINEQREQLQLQRIALTRWLDRLRQESVAMQDETARLIVRGRSLVKGPIFALQGWAPEPRMSMLESFARQQTLVLDARQPTRDEEPPTLLSNPRPIRGAEGAVTFFMTPGYRAWDPTWVMFFSFAGFFAMILADAGYGLVLGILLALFGKRLGRTSAGRQFRQLAVFMVLVTVVYGVVTGSFFGFAAPPGSWLDRMVIKSGGDSIMQDREAMMLISATIGVFHLALANAVVAWRWLGSAHALAPSGWVLALIGGWLYTLALLPKPDLMSMLADRIGGQSAQWAAASTRTGWWLMGTGLVLVFLFSSTRPVFSLRPRDLVSRCVDGFLALTNVTKAFGDSLSYLRLFALGLASAQLAMLFNQMASDASQIQGVGILLGFLVFAAGHTLNFVLGVVGGVVHGLRLTCIEFFSWSLTDEGQPFEAFEMKANK